MKGAGASPGWTSNPGAALRATIRPEIGLGTSKRGIDLAVGHDLLDLRVGLAEDAHRILGGLEVAFGGLLIGRRLIDVLLRAAACLEEVERAREHPLLQFENAGGGQQRRFRLKQIGAVDREQRVACLHFIADVVEGFENFALILREYLNEQILVEVDGADGCFQKREIARGDWPRP